MHIKYTIHLKILGRLAKILFLTILLQLFSFPTAKFERIEHSCFDTLRLREVYFCFILKNEYREKVQLRRKSRSPSSRSFEVAIITPNYKRFVPYLLSVATFVNPVSSSYYGSKLEVLKARSHPPTS